MLKLSNRYRFDIISMLIDKSLLTGNSLNNISNTSATVLQQNYILLSFSEGKRKEYENKMKCQKSYITRFGHEARPWCSGWWW